MRIRWKQSILSRFLQTIGAHVSIDVQEAGLDTAEVGEEAYDSVRCALLRPVTDVGCTDCTDLHVIVQSEDEGGRKEKTYVTKEKGAGGFMSHPVDRRHR